MGTIDEYSELRAAVPLDGAVFGWTGIVLYPVDELEQGQVGYATGAEEENFTGGADGDWRATWLVIGHDDLVGDPIFVDLAENGFPVFTAAHGQGRWDPEPIAGSFERFVRALQIVEAEAAGRSSPAELEANPLPDALRQQLLDRIRTANPEAAMSFWEELLES